MYIFPIFLAFLHLPYLIFHNLSNLLLCSILSPLYNCFSRLKNAYISAVFIAVHIPNNIKPTIIILFAKLILCSSLGAISHKLRVGDIVTIDDHINLTGRNPLYNCDYDKYGHKFIDMSNAYDEQMIDTLIYTAKKEMAIKVKRGVLAEFPGPSAETVAECQFADQIGADVMGFNVCSEIIAAKYCKLPVVVYALVTNL